MSSDSRILSNLIRLEVEDGTINSTMLEGLINDLDAQQLESEACISAAARTSVDILKEYLECPGLSKRQAKDFLLPLLEHRRGIEALGPEGMKIVRDRLYPISAAIETERRLAEIEDAVNEARSRIDRYEAVSKEAREQTRPPALDLGQAMLPGTCSAGHPRPASPLGGWMCPRCGRRIMPFTAEKCFEDHLRPENLEHWTVWVCPEDQEVVVPGDMNRDEILEVNQNHSVIASRSQTRLPHKFADRPQSPLVRRRPGGTRPRGLARGGSPSQPGVDLNYDSGLVMGVMGWNPTITTGEADPNQTLVTVAAPILAGFCLAAIVAIGTSVTLSGRPEALPAMACFAGAAVLLLFSIQLMAIARLIAIRWWHWAGLYELGLLMFLIGLGLFLWPKTWSIAAVFGLSVVGLAIGSDLVLQGVAISKRPRMSALSDFRG